MKAAPKVVKAKATDPVGYELEKKEPTGNLVLTANQFNVIMAGLNELPHKAVGALIPELVKQVQAQVAKKPAK